MSLKDRTKIMFADELEKMLRTTPFDKVRVSKLCERCGTIYPTFYYHFRDKYELVAWIFVHDFVSLFGNTATEYTPEVLERVTKSMESKKTFYQKAFTDKSQNSIDSYVVEFNIKLATAAVRYHSGVDSLTDDQLLAVRYHAYGVNGLFKDFIFDASPITATRMSVFNYEHTPDFLKEAFSNYPYSEKDLLDDIGRSNRKDSKDSL